MGQMLITGWNRAGWMEMPARRRPDRAADRGRGGHVVMGDTLSIKVFQALASALEMRPDRKVILSDTGNFPSDLYMAEGLCGMLGQGHELRTVAPEEVEDAIDDERVAVLMLTEVDYRTGAAARHAAAHREGACRGRAGGLGSGPFGRRPARGRGRRAAPISPSAAPTSTSTAAPAAGLHLCRAPPCRGPRRPRCRAGWATRRPSPSTSTTAPARGSSGCAWARRRCCRLAALDAALDVWDGVDIADLRARSLELTDAFIAGVEAACPDLDLATPRDPARRGSQVSFRHPEGYAIMQALIARGVIGDFRAPDILRFGFTPLFIDENSSTASVAPPRLMMSSALMTWVCIGLSWSCRAIRSFSA
jgi:kynureninase